MKLTMPLNENYLNGSDSSDSEKSDQTVPSTTKVSIAQTKANVTPRKHESVLHEKLDIPLKQV